eukprot:1154880-Pelagomonas_calceolata.AAC.2
MLLFCANCSRTYAFAMRFGLGGLRCDVPGSQVRWLGLAAFERVLGKKQSVYGPVLLGPLEMDGRSLDR